MYKLVDSKSKENITLSFGDYYVFKPKYDGIEEIELYDTELITKCILHRFLNKYRKLVSAVIQIMQSDDEDEGGCAIILDEIAKQKDIILNKYQKFLKKEDEKELLRKLSYLEIELKNKLIYVNAYDEKEIKTR